MLGVTELVTVIEEIGDIETLGDTVIEGVTDAITQVLQLK